MVDSLRLDGFVSLLTEHQRSLYIYVLSLLADPDDAEEVLQNTNLVLWHKADEFRVGTNFVAWATRVAQYQVLAFRKKQRRESVRFDSVVVEELAAASESRIDQNDRRRLALADCLDKLRSGDRRLVHSRYHSGLSVGEVAEQMGRSLAATYQALHRVRVSLMACINSALSSENSS